MKKKSLNLFKVKKVKLARKVKGGMNPCEAALTAEYIKGDEGWFPGDNGTTIYNQLMDGC